MDEIVWPGHRTSPQGTYTHQKVTVLDSPPPARIHDSSLVAKVSGCHRTAPHPRNGQGAIVDLLIDTLTNQSLEPAAREAQTARRGCCRCHLRAIALLGLGGGVLFSINTNQLTISQIGVPDPSTVPLHYDRKHPRARKPVTQTRQRASQQPTPTPTPTPKDHNQYKSATRSHTKQK